MSQQQDSIQSRLLELPAELRNEIYSLVLDAENEASDDDEGRVIICRDRFAQPPLLQVKKQIREEASTIWYYERLFVVNMAQFDSSALSAFLQHASTYCHNPKHTFRLEYDAGPSPRNWPHLFKWLRKSFHDAIMPGISTQGHPEYTALEFITAGRAFEILNDMITAGVSWEVVEKILTSWKLSTEPFMKWTD